MSRSLKGTDDDAGVNDESADLKCVLCEKKGIQQLSEEIVLSNFPLDINLCRSWVKNVGIKELVHMPIRELNASIYLCQKHFHPKCYVKKRNSIFLIAEAVPTEELYYRMLPENIMADFAKEIEQSQTKSSGKTLMNEDSDTIELYKCIICKGNSKPGQSKLLSRFPVEADLLDKSTYYWVDYKAKLKIKNAASRSAQEYEKGSSNQKTMTEMDLKFAQMLDDAQSLRVRVKPFSKLTNSGDLDSKSPEYHSRTPSPTSSTHRPSSPIRRRSCNPLPMSQGSSHTPVGTATSNSSQQQSFDQKYSRVTLCQLEMLYKFLNANRDIATACNRSFKAKKHSQKKWTEFADVVNEHGDGNKDWRGWAKYWVDYKAKLKSKAVRSAQAQAEGELPEKLLTELEGRFLQLLGVDFDQDLLVVLVEPELQNVGDTSNLDMQSFELTSLPASSRANSPEALSDPPPTTPNDSIRAHPAKSTCFRRQTRGQEASSSNIPNSRSRSPIRRPKMEPISPRESRDPSSTSTSLSNSPERRQIRTNRETPRRIRHASSPRQASSSPLPGSRSSIRRRQRHLPVMTQQDARRALVRSSHTTAKASVRSYRALERISEGVSDLSRTAKRIESTGSRRPRVTLSQLETMLAFLEDHTDVACGYNKSAVDRGCHRRHWKSITQCLNSQKDGGAYKDWKGWSAYFTDYKSKIKKKVQRQKTLNEIENRFFVMLKRAFAESVASGQKRISSQGQGTGDESVDSSSDDGRRPDQWPRLSNSERREHWLEKYGPEDLPKPKPVFNPEPKIDYRLDHNESDELPSESNSVQRHRVSLSQLELIWEFLDSHRALVVNRLNTSHLRGCSRIMWISITPRLNSEDGANKVWKEWAKYWADYRYKIQKQVEKNQPLNDIEHKFWTLIMNVNDEYANSNGGNVGVQPYPSSSQTTGYGEDPLGDSSDSEEETKSEPVKPEMLVEILMPVEPEPATAEVEEMAPAPTEVAPDPAEVAPDPAEVEQAAPAPTEVASAEKQPAPSPRRPRRRPLRRRPFLTREASRRYMIAIERERNNILRGFLGRIADTLDRCRVWVKRVGLKELATMTPIELHKTTFLCEDHFNPTCLCITSCHKYLRLTAVPELRLPYPPLENSLIENYSVAEESQVLLRHRRNIGFFERKKKSKSSVSQLSEVECSDEYAGSPEENLSKLSVDLNAIGFVNVRPEFHLLSEEIEFKAPVGQVYSPTSDEIDAVFLKYSERFKKLSNNQQYLFSLDLEELITRFEQKNCKSADLYNEKLKRDFQSQSETVDQLLQKPSPFKITPTKSPPVVTLLRKPSSINTISKDIRRLRGSHVDATLTATKSGPILPGKVKKLKKTNTLPNSAVKLTKISPLTHETGLRCNMVLNARTGLLKPARIGWQNPTVKSELGSQIATRLRGKSKFITRS